MPIYEYRCTDCHEVFEKLIRDGEAGITCPRCRGQSLERKFSVFGMVGAGREPAAGRTAASGCARCAGGHCATCH